MSIHSGHRERIRQRFKKDGLANFEAHEVLELLLFYCIPRCDTNEIAHNLINKHKSLGRVLQASIKELQSTKGVGENAAVFLSLLNEAVRYINVERATENEILNNVQDYAGYLQHLFDGMTNEAIYLLCLDGKCMVLGHYKICEGNVNSTSVPIRKIVDIAITSGATSVVLAHNHPSGLAIPSIEDIQATIRLKNVLMDVDVTLADHLVFSGTDYISLAQHSAYGQDTMGNLF